VKKGVMRLQEQVVRLLVTDLGQAKGLKMAMKMQGSEREVLFSHGVRLEQMGRT